MSGIAGTGFTVLDLVLVLVGVSFAVSGYRRGLVAGVLAVAGFIVGGAVGMGAGPRVVQTLEPGLTQSLVWLLVVLLIAAVGHAVGAGLGRWLRARMTWHPVRVFDSGLGAVVSVVAVLVVMWFVAGALRASPVPAISAAIRSSTIVTEVDEVMPEYARGLFGSFRDLLREDNLPRAFGGLAPERISPVAPPDLVRAQSPQIAEAARSVVRVTGAAQSCRRAVSGSGFVMAPGRVMTNAHVVAGVEQPQVQVLGRGPLLDASVVVFDADRDIAVLAVPDLEAPALTLGGPAGPGEDAAVAGFPGGGEFSLLPARVRERIAARGPDIYNDEQVTREVYSLFVVVRPGNSGGPLLAPDGTVLGVVFATSLDDPETGYALTAAEVSGAATEGAAAGQSVDTGPCAG
jgi:S1-C subfamily serine protease